MEQTIDATAFGRVLGSLMEERGFSAEPATVAELAARAGLEPGCLLARIADEEVVDVGPLNGLAAVLNLSERERTRLAMSYSMEREPVSS